MSWTPPGGWHVLVFIVALCVGAGLPCLAIIGLAAYDDYYREASPVARRVIKGVALGLVVTAAITVAVVLLVLSV